MFQQNVQAETHVKPIALFQAYSPLGSPGSWIKGEVLKEPTLNEIGEKLNKSPAQVALRWGIQSGHSVLPKSVNESRIKDNLMLFDWLIPPELFSKLSAIFQVYWLQKAVHVFAGIRAYNHIYNILRHILLVCDAAKAPPRGYGNPRDPQSLQKPPRTVGW